MTFIDELIEKNINPFVYLDAVKRNAVKFNYPTWETIIFTKLPYKVQITKPDGKIIRFGRAGYNDFLIYKSLAKQKQMTMYEANRHRKNFNKRMIKKNDDLYTARNLSRNLLW